MRHTTQFLAASLVLVGTLLAATPAKAQGLGIQGGFAYDTVSSEGLLDDIQGKSGWLIGLWYGGSAPVTFMGEINYVERTAADETGVGELKTTFIEFPTLLRINLGSSKYRFYPMGGPVFDIQLSGENQDGNDVGDFLNSYQFGMLLGAGVQIGRFAIEGRYIWGLTSILDDSTGIFDDLGLDTDSKNRSFQLTFKLRLN